MLIDISDVLQINVFALGAVFLQMCHILHLENQPMFFRCGACSLVEVGLRLDACSKGCAHPHVTSDSATQLMLPVDMPECRYA